MPKTQRHTDSVCTSGNLPPLLDFALFAVLPLGFSACAVIALGTYLWEVVS